MGINLTYKVTDIQYLMKSDDIDELRKLAMWLGSGSNGSLAKLYLTKTLLKLSRLGCPDSQHALSYNYFLGRFAKQSMWRSCYWAITAFKNNENLNAGMQASASYFCSKKIIPDAGPKYVAIMLLTQELIKNRSELCYQEWLSSEKVHVQLQESSDQHIFNSTKDFVNNYLI